MEPWKLAVIAALGVGVVAFGKFANTPPSLNSAENPVGTQATPGPTPVIANYIGKTLPAWPTIKQWVNSSPQSVSAASSKEKPLKLTSLKENSLNLASMEGQPVNMSSLKGKPVFVEVFRIECSHCQQAAPFIAKLHTRYAPRGMAFVGIQSPGDLTDPNNPEANWSTVQKWIKTQGYTWPVGFDDKSAWFQGTFGKEVFYPSLFLLDKSGKIVFVQTGHDPQKALKLAVELEHMAPGQGDVNAQAKDLARFIAPSLEVPADAPSQKSFATAVANSLKAVK